MVKSTCYVLSLLFFFSIAIKGQKISEQFCKQVEFSIIKPINPTRIDRQEVYNDECVFEFTAEEKIDVSLWIEKYDTERESTESINKKLSNYSFDYVLEEKEIPLEQYATENNWDTIYFHKSETNSFLLLRKGCFIITMFSQKPAYLIQMEPLLYNLKFK